MNNMNYNFSIIVLIFIILLTLISTWNYFFVHGTILEPYGTPVKPPTSIVISVLDSESGKFVDPPIIVNIKTIYEDNVSSQYSIVLSKSSQTITFLVPPPNTTLYFTAKRDGYKESDTYAYVVTSETPRVGIVFNHTFYLEPLEPTRVYINVKDPMNRGIKGADVNITAKYADEFFTGKTDEGGIFSFSSRFENFLIKVFAEGYKPCEAKVNIPYNLTERKHEIILEYLASSIITIEVKDENWNYVPEAKVTLTSNRGSFSEIAMNGKAEFKLPPAIYELVVEKDGYETYKESLDLSKPVAGGKIVQLVKLPWWQTHWYLIVGVGVVLISILIFLCLKIKRRLRK